MNIYLIRHADAVTLGQNNVNTDEDRPLTEVGQAQTAALAATLQHHGVKLDKILHSALVRSQQTAAGIARHWNPPTPTLEVCDPLAPGGRSKKLLRFLRGLEGENFALVGHLPDIAAFAAWLIGGKNAQLDLSKAGVAALAFQGGIEKGEGVLKWLITDKWLR